MGSVPPACRGNLQEGVSTAVFCALWRRSWYYFSNSTLTVLGFADSALGKRTSSTPLR